mmetsp:Transcript_22190/g.25686  ORF Transcript_22190/g.25686 Transcript_22190/m.25686 type:complete len:113 (+) Transcript_22190:561-899(+)
MHFVQFFEEILVTQLIVVMSSHQKHSLLSTSAHDFGNNNNLTYTFYQASRAIPKAEPTNHIGNRLYQQGIQKQRKQAILKNAPEDKGNQLNLATRSYNARSATIRKGTEYVT